ncbi:MAG: hypothetical protein RIC19_15980 [Phaeodactylibacter sp.]|uniref:hypothetical protein n=1 Tax=Phaeodactylibacter sp. TaxID=1940289 RepID=UPI0032F06B7A
MDKRKIGPYLPKSLKSTSASLTQNWSLSFGQAKFGADYRQRHDFAAQLRAEWLKRDLEAGQNIFCAQNIWSSGNFW